VISKGPPPILISVQIINRDPLILPIPMKSYTPTLTFKARGFYVAYAPQSGIVSYGGCFEEAANGLTDQLRSSESEKQTGEERK
jgi:hypothetical protein